MTTNILNTDLNALAPLFPYGARVTERGVRFTLYCRAARSIKLLIFHDAQAEAPDVEIQLEPHRHRIGDLWSVEVEGANPGQFYVYRILNGNSFDPEQWILDPYSTAVSAHRYWGEPDGLPRGVRIKNGRHFPKSVITQEPFDWHGDRPLNNPIETLVIYEAHVRGFTQHDTSGVRAPGTYRGLIDKLGYLRELGVTSIELLPIFDFNELEYWQEGNARAELRNYWGYSTRSFFAPQPRFAEGDDPQAGIRELKEFVKAAHEHGIEVILDVVFNHTSENGDGGPISSFRGLAPEVYYLIDEAGHYQNYSGCGNTVNANHPITRQFILDCLRYWVTEFHIDGFRFDLATALTRGQDGSLLPHPPLIELLDADPILADTKFIAEAWDAAGAYQVGSYPSPRWPEWNGRYRDDMRAFWNGGDHLLRKFVQRLLGSPDLFHGQALGPHKSLNFITCHDGFTLNDLVSYKHKHNEANTEKNRDGENHNHSENFGVEGITQDPLIQETRKRQQKNLLATLMVSQGIPMLLAGDEFSQSQNGNNNCYCQDNENTWLEWSLLDEHADLHDFLKMLIQFRKETPVLRLSRFLGDDELAWIPPKGQVLEWDTGKSIALQITALEGSVFIAFNADAVPASFLLPARTGGKWERAFATHHDFSTRRGHTVEIPELSMAAWKFHKKEV